LVSVFKLVPTPAKSLDADHERSSKIRLLPAAVH
jgi:hypothetical protein